MKKLVVLLCFCSSTRYCHAGFDDEAPRSSTFAVGSRDTVPSAQTWSSLTWATYDGEFLIHDPSNEICRATLGPAQQQHARRELVASASCMSEVVLLASSKYSLFFHASPAGAEVGRVTREPFGRCDLTYREPVYVLNILTWQVGHFIVDVLEPLHSAMMRNGGGVVDRDAHLVFDVANENERRVLRAKMDENNTVFSLLGKFTNFPVRTKEEFFNGGRICFAEVHLELDISRSTTTPAAWRAAERGQRSLRAFLEVVPPKDEQRLVFIRRRGSRELTNAEELINVARQFMPTDVVILEDLTFTEQREIFSAASIVVAQYGSGAHNVLFVPSPATLLLLPMPGWCDFSEVYVQQALLSGLSVLKLCSSSSFLEPHQQRWSRRGHMMGPWATKDTSWPVHSASFREALLRAVQLTEGVETTHAPSMLPPSSSLGHTNNTRVHVSDLRIEPAAAGEIAKVMIVAEVLRLTPEDWVKAEICLRDAHDDVEMCFTDEIFNEFATLDVQVPWMSRLSLVIWLRVNNQDVERSETHLSLIVDGVYEGRGMITHDATPLSSKKATYTTLNWQNYASEQDGPTSLQRDVSEQGLLFRVDGPTSLQRDVAEHCRSESLTSAECADVAQAAHAAAQAAEMLPRSESLTSAACADVAQAHAAAQAAEREQGSRLGGPTTEVAAHCRSEALITSAECADDAQTAHAAAPQAAEIMLPLLSDVAKCRALPAPLSMPSAEEPFVFLHNEKTAGTSLRTQLVFAARQLGLAYYVPCWSSSGALDNNLCYAFDLSNATSANGGSLAELSVVAGHFEFGAWPLGRRPRLFTMLRHPVDRAISYYYERVFPDNQMLLNDLTEDSLRWIGENFRGSGFSRYRDEGLCESMCRMLLGRNDHKGRRPEEVDHERASRPLDHSLALSRLSDHVIGVQEHWALTLRVIEHWFPWFTFKDAGFRANVGHLRETRRSLKRPLRDVILQCNVCDSLLYDEAILIFKAQLRQIDLKLPDGEELLLER